jgi:hypothetical protein
MRIMHLAPTLQPYCPATATARAARALPVAQADAGHEVAVITAVPPTDLADVEQLRPLARRLSPLAVGAGPSAFEVEVLEGKLASSRARLYMLRLPPDGEGEAFPRAATALLETLPRQPELLHLHGATGADPDALRARFDGAAVVQAVYDAREESPTLAAAIRDADSVMVPCHGLWDASSGEGSDVTQALAALDKARVLSFALDANEWNPGRDGFIAAHYAADNLQGKAICRAQLQQEAGLAPRDDAPILAVWSRGGADGAAAFVAALVPELLRLDLQLVAVGGAAGADADPDPLEQALQREDGAWVAPAPRSVADVAPLHRVLAGADAVLLPDLRAPLGQRAQAAQRYGLVPVARAVHAHRDQLVEYDARSASGGAFLFDSDEECFQAVHRMVRAFRDRADWEQVVRANALVESGWERTLAHLDQIYKKALAR